MSTESEDERIKRWERCDRQRAAHHRSRMRWWKHAREYLSLKRLLTGNLLRESARKTLPSHEPWSSPSNWWPRHRWTPQG